MNILIPMAGAGSRFTKAGYKLHKPIIPVSSRYCNIKVPMVVAAVDDLPIDQASSTDELIFVVRDFHHDDGVCATILERFPKAHLITIDRLTEGQASTCLLARELIDNEKPLLIAACDNGMDFNHELFKQMAKEADAIIFTFRRNEAVVEKPQAYGWIKTQGNKAIGVSIKKPISNTPMEDHAVVGTFWFKHGHDFVAASDKMIAKNDRVNGEFYVDQMVKYLIDDGADVRVLEIDRYLCWGTPEDYENYENTLKYWTRFVKNEEWLS